MLRSALFVVTAASAILVAGCTLVTEPAPPKELPLGDELLINEIFALPPDRYYAYSWIELYNPTSHSISWFDELLPARLNAAGSAGTFIKTENDGDDWAQEPNAPAVDFTDIDFPYPDTGYAFGAGGEIYRVVRRNGLYDFDIPEQVPTGSGAWNAVSGIPLTVSGYAVGNGGRIARTTSRGVRWASQTSNTTKNLHDVSMVSVALSFACGDSGTILRSTVPNQWIARPVGEASRNVSFRTIGWMAESVWVAGTEGTVLVSRNRGESFLPETTNVTATLRGSQFLRRATPEQPLLPPRSWIVGDNGTILFKEGNGGRWNLQQSNTTEQLNKVVFVDSVRGWVAGNSGLILATTNAGRTWTTQSSGTTQNLTTVFGLSLNIRVLTRYVLQMRALRKEFFFDLTTGTPNFDYIVRQDTGYCFFDPGILADEGISDPPPPIPKNGFVIINSDSGRFDEHTDIGPGRTQLLNLSIAYYFDTTSQIGVRPVLWDLLESGEVRLIKFFFRQIRATGEFLDFTQETIDVVRWGGYMPTTADFPPEELYPNNVPLGPIPEWWSLARFVNDPGTDPENQNTAGSFYLSDKPVPGWYSQISK